MGAVAGSRQFLFEETARQRLDPGPGLIGQIIREHGDEITDFDLAGLADGAFTGGLETSASMLALGTAVLLERPELWEMLIAGDETVTDGTMAVDTAGPDDAGVRSSPPTMTITTATPTAVTATAAATRGAAAAGWAAGNCRRSCRCSRHRS